MRQARRAFVHGSFAWVTLLASASFAPAHADPLRLRGDAIAQTQGTSSPTGLLVLQGSEAAKPWLSVEGLVWTGAKPTWTGDVLVLMVRLREPHGYAELHAGRFLVSTGAVRPVQIDGVDVVGRAPWGGAIEAFGGLPVAPRFGARAYDWIVGGRVSQTVESKATLGVSFVERREYGEISDEELGGDLALALARWLDIAAFAGFDLVDPGITEARASAAARAGDWRVEVFASQLSPGRLLPATSLFSVLGDLPSQTAGATVRWRAAPRLDLLASGAGQDIGGVFGGNGWVRASLKLDDRGDGSLGAEVRRVDLPGARWTGARFVAALPIARGLRYSSEIEIVAADDPRGRGKAWPWWLSALSWRAHYGWEIAAGVEAFASPTQRYEVDGLVRLVRTLDLGLPAPPQPSARGAGRAEAR
jgi:hypothetical protein